jgi:hypothetical protein
MNGASDSVTWQTWSKKWGEWNSWLRSSQTGSKALQTACNVATAGQSNRLKIHKPKKRFVNRVYKARYAVSKAMPLQTRNGARRVL